MLNANISKRRNYKTNKTARNLIKPGLLKYFGQNNNPISEIEIFHICLVLFEFLNHSSRSNSLLILFNMIIKLYEII